MDIDLRHYALDINGPGVTELSPDRCPNGHMFGPNRVLIGRTACDCTDDHHHRQWTCVTCDAVAVWPPCSKRPDWHTWWGIDAP